MTVVTTKDQLRVVIYTNKYWIEGDMHILADSRLTDCVNVRNRDFFPITNAHIIDPRDNRVLYQLGYLALNRDSIIMIFPKQEITPPS